MMNQRQTVTIPRIATGVRRVAIATLVVTLLASPVSYRAGIDTAHAHSFVQFLRDAGHGRLDHHRETKAEHAAHVADPAAEQTSVVTSAPPGTPLLDGLGPAHERTSAIGLALVAAGFSLLAARPFVERGSLLRTGRRDQPPSPPPRFVLATR